MTANGSIPERMVDSDLEGNAGNRTFSSLVHGLLVSVRPSQWVKNLLILAAPFLGGSLFQWSTVGAVLLAVLSFTSASAAMYLLNDVRDAALDSGHPTKRLRPIAAGVVPRRIALIAALILLTIALGVAAVLPGAFMVCLLAYVGLTLSYQAGLKDVALVELMIVASGFVLRLVAGGAATDVYLSSWFLIVGASGALFVVSSKRHAEMCLLTSGAARHRPVLSAYSTESLGLMRSSALAVMTLAYSVWAFGYVGGHASLLQVSVIPLFFGFVRLAQFADSTGVTSPELILARDHQTQVWFVTWATLLTAGAWPVIS